MELIDRYIHEVGRYLPRKNRADIQVELRSLLTDALEDQAGGQPGDADVTAVLKKFGSPRSVAAKYYPEGQYLIGPTLYPFFTMVAGIVVAAVTGAQIIAWLVAYFFAGEVLNPLEILGSIPAVLGWVVLVFFILQRFDVQPDKGEEWDPSKLPQVDAKAEIDRGEHIFSIIVESVLLSILIAFSNNIGIYTSPGGPFFSNPILGQYFGWIILSLLVSICIEINLVWQGRWNIFNRLAQLAANVFSLIVLIVLVQAHTVWLQARGVSNFLLAVEALVKDLPANGEIITVWAFWMTFTVALIITGIEIIVSLVRMVRREVPVLKPAL